ncbi:hypothetical protein QJS04_geneDACA015364 [Acorus gramineus]|uniref:BRO1 domain-containing protein n=1 Tax=Acorus gramineus TaxID=55184 RepID=A0AAV9AR97_ACOGR|nr:hypothetical protein QJS04_geneDACA015364 [Acorus gramineus]
MAGSSSSSVMLAVHEKKTVTVVDLYGPLRRYISQNYSEREALDLEEDLHSLRQMRSDVEKAASACDARRDLLQAYYRALCATESRFPISAEQGHVNGVTFTWQDAFKPSRKCAQPNIHLEKAAVLFNLGAVLSQIALNADRSSSDGHGLRLACGSFQSSAGAFAFLRDHVAPKVGSPATVDISPEAASMLERLMLAQAQECFFEKAVSDAKPPALCSKIARQVALYYEEAHLSLNAPPLNQHFDRTWISHVLLKSAQFFAEACYRMALHLHEKEEIAEEIARLKSGISALTDAKRSAKGVAAPLLDATSKLEANLNRNLDRAVKENDRVYLMRVPSPDSLPPLPAATLVKPTPMDGFLDASGEKLFAGIVPDGSAKALSRYTEMVDEIIRKQAERLQQGSEITRVKLKEMDLPDSILALEGNSTLPLDLKDDVEAVQIVGGPAGMDAELQQLRDLKRVNQEMLVQVEELLQKESREDAQFRTQFGTRWTRPQSSTLTKNLQDRLNRFAGNLKQASESDARIERAVKEHMALMSILDQRPIESALPSLARPIMSLDGNEDAIVGTLKQSLRQLEALGAQRAGLEDILKEMKRKDDILPKLMATTGSYDDLFRKEVSKYDHICEQITQNIEAQEQLLLQIQAQNDHFTTIFNLEDFKASREKCYKQIAAAISKFQEIKENINEGLKFYVTLQDAITNVKQQCSDFVMTRNIQCRDMIEDVQKQMAGFNFSDGKTGYNYPSAGQHPQRDAPSHGAPSTAQQPRAHAPYPAPGYAQEYHSYASSSLQPQQQLQSPPYHVPPPAGNHYQFQQPMNHEYGQPAYPGWRGPYYNAPQPQQQQQPGSLPPPYTAPSPYHAPPHQGGYYKQQ